MSEPCFGCDRLREDLEQTRKALREARFVGAQLALRMQGAALAALAEFPDDIVKAAGYFALQPERNANLLTEILETEALCNCGQWRRTRDDLEQRIRKEQP